jgi:hypothetical protein
MGNADVGFWTAAKGSLLSEAVGQSMAVNNN